MAGPFFGSGPYRHTDLGKAGLMEPVFYSLGVGYVPTGGSSERPPAIAFPLIWSYEVPDGKKVSTNGIVIHASQQTVIGATNFDHARDGAMRRSGIIQLKVDGTAVWELEGRGNCTWEQGPTNGPQSCLARDACLQTKLDLGDGIQFTAGQSLTVEADIVDPAHTIEGAWLSVAKLRLWGKNTGTDAFMSLDATLRAPYFGNDQLFHWNGDTTVTSYDVPSGGFTCLGGSLRVEVGDNLIACYLILYHNDVPIVVLGPANSASGLTIEPIFIPLYGVDLVAGDRLELRGSMGADFGQVISVQMLGAQSSLATYPRSRVGVP